MQPLTTEEKPRRRWFRFSLRALMICTALVGMVMAWIAKERMQSARERELAVALQKQGWHVTYESQDLQGFLTPIVGDRIYSVGSTNTPIESLAPFAQLTRLGSVGIGFSQSFDGDLTPLARLTALELLAIDSDRVTDLTPLAGLVNLRHVCLSQAEVRDLTPLTGLKNLQSLSLQEMNVSAEQLNALEKALPGCRIEHEPVPVPPL